MKDMLVDCSLKYVLHVNDKGHVLPRAFSLAHQTSRYRIGKETFAADLRLDLSAAAICEQEVFEKEKVWWISLFCRGDIKQDPNKRRHTSGSRQLSTISDGPDPLDLLALMGFDRSPDGQDVSFSSLLTNSKRQKVCDAEHQHLSRCYSLDPSNAASKSHSVSISPICILDNKGLSADEKKHQFQQSFPYIDYIYHPNLLDDPELIAGKHSTLLAFPSYVVSAAVTLLGSKCFLFLIYFSCSLAHCLLLFLDLRYRLRETIRFKERVKRQV